MKHQVCQESEIEPGTMREVRVDGVSIVLLRKPDGSFHALRNRCPHQGGPLAEGWVEPMVVSAASGEAVFSEEKVVVRCPFHHWEFDPDTGCSPADAERFRVRIYPVTVEGGAVYVERSGRARTRERELGGVG